MSSLPSSVLNCLPGRPWPLGVTPMALDGRTGLNVAVFSRRATAVELCCFSADGATEMARLRLPACTDGIWHGFVPGLGAGQRYGLRAHGPWDPRAGHFFNPAKLLIDPWARSLPGSVDKLALETGFRADAPELPDAEDNAARMPKARVLDLEAELRAGAAIAPGPGIAMAHTVLYEAHVKSLTRLHPEVPEAQRGTYAGLASPVMLAHYRRIGVTSLCLLPVQRHLDERHLIERGLVNHWGYNTLGFFVPEPRYASAAARADALGGRLDDAGVRAEFRAMVDTLHRHGIEVLLDVVYNHSAEGGALGPTLSWRGLDNAAWYALDAQGHYLNPTGCGNTFDMGGPHVVQMVMDSLRWWVQAFGVDGFRFDLAVSLGRDPLLGRHFHPLGALFAAIAQDPVLARVKWIAEPWDVGADGYQIGRFGPRWHEWNDQLRDTLRAWWLGPVCTRGQLARRLTGSSDIFEATGRSPLASINMVTAHDGFTLADLTSYSRKHNEANGENNRDGNDYNLSANGGHEGPTQDPVIVQRRARWRRGLLATLLCAQGVPQLLAGDEIAHSQQGNNNAYCQDNPISWLDWAGGDAQLTDFVAGLTALRRRYPGLRHAQWFHGVPLPGENWPDIEWRTASGAPPQLPDWERADGRLLICTITVGEADQPAHERLLLVVHAGEQAVDIQLPPGHWQPVLDSAQAWVACDGAEAASAIVQTVFRVTPQSVHLLVQPLHYAPRALPPPPKEPTP
ncbi:glycogen debranching protein GlgX [Extensimonas vulgaris]|nr:glycogen debranching protein GlgX [Extensimonas vulgaris]TXD15965.1 glycogen debranching protein GlgX [Extensimonas vulgaris]